MEGGKTLLKETSFHACFQRKHTTHQIAHLLCSFTVLLQAQPGGRRLPYRGSQCPQAPRSARAGQTPGRAQQAFERRGEAAPARCLLRQGLCSGDYNHAASVPAGSEETSLLRTVVLRNVWNVFSLESFRKPRWSTMQNGLSSISMFSKTGSQQRDCRRNYSEEG